MLPPQKLSTWFQFITFYFSKILSLILLHVNVYVIIT